MTFPHAPFDSAPLIRPRWLCAAWVIALMTISPVRAEDWPQILGPNRDGTTKEAIPAWKSSGPELKWKNPVGSGFAGVAVSGGLVVAFHRQGDEEILEAWRAADGAPVWKTAFPATYRGGINADRGPRCVPVIAKDNVFGYGAAGDLYCVALKDGEKKWSRALAKDYRALAGYFGAGSTPVVVGDRVLLNVGGRAEAELVAVKASTGETVWKRGSDNASYSSPTLWKRNGREDVVFVTRLHCVAVEPRTGKELFRFRFGQTGPTVNAATPLVIGDRLFLSASYGIGAQMHRINSDGAKELWSNDTSMSSQYATSVYRDGHLYGIDGREDAGRGALRCIDAATGKVRWSEPAGIGHVLLCRDQLLIVDVEGKLKLVKANSDRYQLVANHTLGAGTWRAIPAVSDGRIYLRDSSAGQVYCYQP